MTPTDPVKELIEAAEKATAMPWHTDDYLAYVWGPDQQMVADTRGENDSIVRMRGVGAQLPIEQNLAFIIAASKVIPSLSAMVAREEAVREYIKELRAHPDAIYRPLWAAERLEQIFPKEGAK